MKLPLLTFLVNIYNSPVHASRILFIIAATMHELGCFCAHLSPLSHPGLLAARSRGKKISLPLEKKKILFEKERKTRQSFFYCAYAGNITSESIFSIPFTVQRSFINY